MGIGQDLWQIIQYGRDALEALQDETTGTIVNTYNAIVDIWEINCEGSWVLYVKTGLTASGAALYLLLTPSFEEVLENYLEPKPGRLGGRRGRPDDRKRRTGLGGGSRVFFKPGIPDIDTELASWLPGGDLFSGRLVGPGEYVFWTTVDVVDRVLWQFLLIEATETFFTRWISGMMQSGTCSFPNDGSCQFETPIHTTFFAKNLWNSKYTLTFLHEENLDVSNNGELNLPEAWNIADWMVTIESQWSFTGGATPGHLIIDFGLEVTFFDTIGNIVLQETTQEQVTFYQNQTVTRTIAAVYFPFGAHHAKIKYFHDVYHASTTYTNQAWSKFAAATRNTRVQ